MQQRRKFMKNHLPLLKNIPLFEEISEEDLNFLLQCLDSSVKSYPKDSILYLAGSKVTQVGILLSGELQVIREDIAGNRTILTELTPGDLFGETFVCAEIDKSPVTVLATMPSEVMMIRFRHMITTCHSGCSFHTKLIENMMKTLARKNIYLNSKIQILSQRSTREKIMEYLMLQAEREEKTRFSIPYSRNELADFLCVDRSAMSRELSKMQDDGLILVEKNKFQLLV